MLLMFKVKNYTSFKEETILDLRATAYKQHPDHLIKINDKMSLLKVAALYGANASGKSNFIAAMFSFEDYIMSQLFNQREDPDLASQSEVKRFRITPFILSDNVKDATEFDIIFLRNGKQFQYGFECTTQIVMGEWLYIDDDMVFERKDNSLRFGAKYKKQLSAYQKVPDERLYIAVLDYFLETDIRKNLLGDFVDFFTEEYSVYLGVLIETTVKGIFSNRGDVTQKLVNDADYRKKVEIYLRQIDVGIEGLDIKTETVFDKRTGKEEKRKVVRTIHRKYDESGQVVGEELLSLAQESSGTLRFLAYIQRIISLLSSGGVFIVDEMSANLHPLLTKLMIDIFCSQQNEKAQLIFTTHDVSLLNHDQFRRDEVFFIDKNERGESSLYALSDLKVREDASFGKDYLQGKYGAIPIFDCDTIMGDE